MIRPRRTADLDPLCDILRTMDYPSGSFSGDGLKAWLTEDEAEQSWVFDMAPVTVAPTKNVVGHVQMYSLTENSSSPHLPECAGEPASRLVAIGKLFVRPSTYEYGIGRFLLRESVRYIQGQGKVPVLDLHGNGPLTQELSERLGFHAIRSGRPDVAPMVHAAASTEAVGHRP
jgi:ribosomal protein S18 acetylase RimI-like enzyme